MAPEVKPTMAGFKWSETEPFVSPVEGANGWCVRDAVCQFFGWERDSEEWNRFIEGPQGEDVPRLAEHLGLTVFVVDAAAPDQWNQLITRLAHPGIAMFDFDGDEMSHWVYVHDVTWLTHHWPEIDGQPAKPGSRWLKSYGWPLGPEHMERGPVLRAVLLDEDQPPHPYVPPVERG